MFCKYCGKPVDETTMRCRICGRPVGQLEGGNGFWDLLEGKSSGEPAGDSAELERLQRQVQNLRTEMAELQSRPAAKKSGFGLTAALLALLALALGVFALLQMRSLAGKLEEMNLNQPVQMQPVQPPVQQQPVQPPVPQEPTPAPQEQEETVVEIPAAPEPTPSETENGDDQITTGEQAAVDDPDRLRTPRELAAIGLLPSVDLDAETAGKKITYVLYPAYFDGPRGNGVEDKRQDVVRFTDKDPDKAPILKHNIFIATFLGVDLIDESKAVAADPGDYDVYWAIVELDKEGKLTAVERLDLKGDRYTDDTSGNKHTLSIRGGAKEDELGYYALIAERLDAPDGAAYAYVSEIIELYIKD